MTDEKKEEQTQCPGPGDYVSWEEEFVLKRMRELKSQAAKVKSRIKRLSEMPGKEDELEAAEARLEELKKSFRELEEARDRARDDKMRALGHME